MSTQYLKRFFKPKSIAVFGASEKPRSMGGMVLKNLQTGGFEGDLFCVNTENYASVFDLPCYQRIQDLPQTPDLAIICTSPDTLEDLVRQLGQHSVRAVLILTGGLSVRNGQKFESALKDIAREYGIRIMGPDCMGFLVPGSKLNASYTHLNIAKGKVAYIGQSGLLGAAMIDWACGQDIGFSHFMTLGNSADVDLPSVIDYVANDPYTHAILLQLDRVTGSPKSFLSALRSASRNKLVLVLKSDIVSDEELKTPAAPGIPDDDMVYDAALRRSGVVRVDTSDQLFSALESLSRMKPLRGEKLAILCNGMGPNALATDRLLKKGGQLAEFSDSTLEQLSAVLPETWNRKNPIDLNADAEPERFSQVMSILGKDKLVDAILSIHAPTRCAPSVETAEKVIAAARKVQRNVLTCWMGSETAVDARNHCHAANIASFKTPEEAVETFMHMVDHRRNQEVMRQTPPSYIEQNTENHIASRKIIAEALQQDRDYLTHAEACDLLDQYEIPVQAAFYAEDIYGVVAIAKDLDEAVAVRALHQKNIYPFNYTQSQHKSQQKHLDSVQDIHSADEVKLATTRLAYRQSESYGDQGFMGFCVQQMKRGFQSLQINAGITRDPTFGPVIVFGAGGYTVDVLADRRVMLPPINLSLATELVKSSRVSKIIREYSYQPERDIEQLAEVVVKLSEMIVDLPAIQGLEINPLLINKSGILAMDVSVSIGEAAPLSISPYPGDLEEPITLKKSGRPAVVRPVRGEDEPCHLEFYNSLSPDSVMMRFFYSRGIPTHQELAGWTQIDYNREMAFIVSAPRLDGRGPETLGVVRVVTDADNISTEFSVVIRDDLQGEGLGVILMQKAIDYARSQGTLMIEGSTLLTNKSMQGLAKKLGFKNRFNMEEEVVDMKMLLNAPVEEWQRVRLAQHGIS